MENNKITSIKVTIGLDNEQSATATFEVSTDEQFETMFCSNLIPAYPMTLYVVTRNKSGGPQIINKVEILKTE